MNHKDTKEEFFVVIRLMVKKLDADKRRFTLIFASGSASIRVNQRPIFFPASS